MLCPYCNFENQTGAVYCVSCGAIIEQQQQYSAPPENNPENSYQWQQGNNQNYYPVPPAQITEGESKSKSSLIMGILSIALCWLFGIPGIILGALAISSGKKARRMLNESFYMYYNALAGVITGGVGLGLSIFSSVCWVAIIASASSVSNKVYYY